jgi:3-deoxy-7-phosphoheptulonate synthase
MHFKNTEDLRINALRPLISPAILSEEYPLDDAMATLVTQARTEAGDIVRGDSDRLLVVIGPCSIHDTEAALEYGKRLSPLRAQYQKELCIIMRVYFEKPRTTVGWKGLINDPLLDGSFNINKGLHIARKLLSDLAAIGIPAGTEFLDTIIPQYIADFIAWGAIGARTTESQLHRELASGLSMPIGFKNSTMGDIQIAIEAVLAAKHPHHFLGVSKHGLSAIVSTKGNDTCHIILRGGKDKPNYEQEYIDHAVQVLAQHTLPSRLMVDCSHGNSQKNFQRQVAVAADLALQMRDGSHAICGVMIESHLHEGNQPYHAGKPLKYGVSITDACISWETTETVLAELAQAVSDRRRITKR